jgi:hypothetical protein
VVVALVHGFRDAHAGRAVVVAPDKSWDAGDRRRVQHLIPPGQPRESEGCQPRLEAAAEHLRCEREDHQRLSSTDHRAGRNLFKC